MKDRKSIYIASIILLVAMISIGYALLSGTLNINGSAKITAATWEIYFKNVKIKDGSVTAIQAPSITDKTTVNFEVELKKPGDFYEFNVDVVNNGMLDAMIESISITPELTTDQQKYLNYLVTYADGVAIEEKDILHANKKRTLKVKVEYKKNIDNSALLSSDQVLSLTFNVKYTQADTTAKESTSNESNINVINILTGDGTNSGNEVSIGNEQFYVISNDGTNVTLLTKYNLNITDPYDNSKSYIQNTGYDISPISFSLTNYWTDSSYPTSYPKYIYDSNSLIKVYVDNYKVYLESLGIEILEARLINDEELILLNCLDGYACGTNAEPWVYTSSYWTGVSTDNSLIKQVYSDGRTVDNFYDSFGTAGIRPVIVVPANSI